VIQQLRLYDQVILRAATEAQTSARPIIDQPKKEIECAMHTKPEAGVGLESPLEYIAQREARHCRLPTQKRMASHRSSVA
jgi:hypothetical protein